MEYVTTLVQPLAKSMMREITKYVPSSLPTCAAGKKSKPLTIILLSLEMSNSLPVPGSTLALGDLIYANFYFHSTDVMRGLTSVLGILRASSSFPWYLPTLSKR